MRSRLSPRARAEVYPGLERGGFEMAEMLRFSRRSAELFDEGAACLFAPSAFVGAEFAVLVMR